MTKTDTGGRGEGRACERCRGDGFFYRVPNGFNPFYAGGFQTASAAYRVECYVCDGSGRAALQAQGDER